MAKIQVKDIDMERLKAKYTTGGKSLIKPERQAKFLAIDEFSLHKGHVYATGIIDLESGLEPCGFPTEKAKRPSMTS